ncbi:sigma-70 family RNA polymerase sigma factor [Solirubrobacter ginsenosidimutans]|uniref:RNA polymerase sigma factor n=1 Tax=Solirubrobacter ginsenosidimutans TaxID=490573 RepID=A0A9X3RZ98_9ACTN|nr:sigma-70 family RNA polymerase sigma factor [Solirubrobacter ginsenosidimutans]MDA0159944.1 sigma-70 family RNA polymerase sigma factor [Solirubrobacter ginsenosidimutans]
MAPPHRFAPSDSGTSQGSSAVLSRQRERDLVVATEGGSKAACRELVEAFLPAIARLARQVDPGRRVDRVELMQEGVAGLLLAVKRYDARMETPFWAYASFWVRKAMRELLAELAGPVALTDHAVRGLVRVKGARREHLQAHGTEPTRAELVAATGFAPAQLDSLLASERAAQSLDAPVGGGATVSDTLADPLAEDEYEQVLDRIEQRESVRGLTGVLDDRERTVLSGRYGLDQAQQTLSEIGATLGLTAERVRQIEAGALAKLRAAAAEPR